MQYPKRDAVRPTESRYQSQASNHPYTPAASPLSVTLNSKPGFNVILIFQLKVSLSASCFSASPAKCSNPQAGFGETRIPSFRTPAPTAPALRCEFPCSHQATIDEMTRHLRR